MCVIVYKPYNTIIPESIIRDCFTHNPDGAGYTVINENGVFTRKGFMTVDSLLSDLSQFTTNCACVLHFRISTSGVINPVNCHPYPITNKPELYTRLNLDGLDVVYHNGILLTKYTSWSNDIELYSDTMLLARDILSKSYPNGRVNILSLISNTSTNKFITVSKTGKVTLYGNFTEKDGLYFSNMYWSYKPVTVYNAVTNSSSSSNIETGKGTTTHYDYTKSDSNRCKHCKSFLFNYEKTEYEGLCSECYHSVSFNKNKNKKVKSTSKPKIDRHCAYCGISLLTHESYACDDCIQFYQKHTMVRE